MWQGNTRSYFLQDHVMVVIRCPAKVTQDVVRVDGTDAPLRDTGPGYDGKGCRMDGTANGAHRDSK